MLTGKVYERRPFELALYFLAVYNLNIAGTPTVLAESEMFGNDGAFTVFQLIECFAENLPPSFVVVHPGWLGGGIDSYVLRIFFTFLAVLVGKLSVKIREHHIPDAADQHIFCYLRFTSDGKSNLIDGLVIALEIVFCIDILRYIRSLDRETLINGGDVFVREYIRRGGEPVPLFDGVNQENVYTHYDFASGRFRINLPAEREYFDGYLETVMESGFSVYVTEYANRAKTAEKALEHSAEHGYRCCVSDNIELMMNGSESE